MYQAIRTYFSSRWALLPVLLAIPACDAGVDPMAPAATHSTVAHSAEIAPAIQDLLDRLVPSLGASDEGIVLSQALRRLADELDEPEPAAAGVVEAATAAVDDYARKIGTDNPDLDVIRFTLADAMNTLNATITGVKS